MKKLIFLLQQMLKDSCYPQETFTFILFLLRKMLVFHMNQVASQLDWAIFDKLLLLTKSAYSIN